MTMMLAAGCAKAIAGKMHSNTMAIFSKFISFLRFLVAQ
jgi:hypothetical protein